MKTLAVVGLVAMTVLGVDSLADHTQNRPDPVVDGSSTEIVYDVGTRDYNGTDTAAAQALWAVCAASVSGTAEGPSIDAAGHYRVSISPAIGDHGRKRVVGCLEDGTLDRVQGHVQSVSTR